MDRIDWEAEEGNFPDTAQTLALKPGCTNDLTNLHQKGLGTYEASLS